MDRRAQTRRLKARRLSREDHPCGGVRPLPASAAEFLKKGMKRGTLCSADPKTAAMQFLSLLESELLQRVLLGVTSSVKPEALNSAARRAVEPFVSGYARR